MVTSLRHICRPVVLKFAALKVYFQSKNLSGLTMSLVIYNRKNVCSSRNLSE